MPSGHEGGALFVLGQHGLDFFIIEGVVNRQYVSARHTEDSIDA